MIAYESIQQMPPGTKKNKLEFLIKKVEGITKNSLFNRRLTSKTHHVTFAALSFFSGNVPSKLKCIRKWWQVCRRTT